MRESAMIYCLVCIRSEAFLTSEVVMPFGREIIVGVYLNIKVAKCAGIQQRDLDVMISISSQRHLRNDERPSTYIVNLSFRV